MNVINYVILAMFTSSFEHIYCIEGEKLQLKCSVYSASIAVEWYKDNANQYKQHKIERNKNISIDHKGKDHVLTIQNAKKTDSGKYIIIAGNVRKELPVIVKGNLKKINAEYSYFLLAFYSVYVLICWLDVLIVSINDNDNLSSKSTLKICIIFQPIKFSC